MAGGTAGERSDEWYLGVDLGTTYTAAAVRRGDHSEIVTLGTRAAVEPAVVVATDDGLVVGEAAERRAGAAPERTVRQFKRRLGDPAPLLLGGVPYSPQALLAAELADVVERTTVEQGGPPARVAITHPANWGPYKRELVRQVAELAGLAPTQVRTLTEPAAAAIHYAAQSGLEPGSVVGVYDLGGGTFDAAVVRIEPAGAELLGEPTGIEHLGGIDVDAAVFGHVRAQLGARFDALEGEEHAALLARLREECVRAKEALSSDTDTVIGVPLPDGYAQVRLTRSELEAMIRPALAPTADALRRAIDSAGLTPEELAGVLLVGGSSRIPLVSQLVSGALGRPVLLDAHPKHAVALGAAAYAAGDRVDEGAVPIVGDTAEVAVLATAAPSRRRRRRVAAAVVAVAALLGGGVAAAQLASDTPGDDVSIDGGDGETTTTTDDETTSTDTTSSTSWSTTTTTTEVTGTTDDPGQGTVRPGTTGPPPPTTQTTVPVAPGAPTGAFLTGPSIVGGTTANPRISIELRWTPPANDGTGIDEYVLTGRMLFGGTSLIRTESVPFATSGTTHRFEFISRGLGEQGYIEWRLVARNEAGSGPATTVTARVPSVLEMSTSQVYHVLWSTGVRVDTFDTGTCTVDTVCAQDVPPNSTVPNASTVDITISE